MRRPHGHGTGKEDVTELIESTVSKCIPSKL